MVIKEALRESRQFSLQNHKIVAVGRDILGIIESNLTANAGSLQQFV